MTMVVGHRGAPAYRAEMTAASFETAVRMGVDAVECDVRMTRDGELVCWHDATVDRCSDGRGSVSSLTLAQLRELDCSARFAPTESTDVELCPVTRQIVTLRELLSYLAGLPRPVGLLLETKHPSVFGGEVEDRVVAELAAAGITGDKAADPISVRVMSFSAAALQRTMRLAPALNTVLLTDRDLTAPLPSAWGRHPQMALGTSIRAVREHPDTVSNHKAAGREVLAWTVNTARDMGLCQDAGVSAMISDRPDLAMAAVGRPPALAPTLGGDGFTDVRRSERWEHGRSDDESSPNSSPTGTHEE